MKSISERDFRNIDPIRFPFLRIWYLFERKPVLIPYPKTISAELPIRAAASKRISGVTGLRK